MIKNSLSAQADAIGVGDRPAAAPRKPAWLKRPVAFTGKKIMLSRRLSDARLNTVCDEAKCPNKAECWARGSATFLILGASCTRGCGFCNVGHGTPEPLDDSEPGRLCAMVVDLQLKHVVITSVTRDDLPDGGAAHFARTVRLLRSMAPHCTVEILVPDFNGNEESLQIVVSSRPDVFNHNIETVARLYPAVRPKASYGRSLRILAEAARHKGTMLVKSGLMVGLSETTEEVEATLKDLREAGCDVVTIGQYLQPSKRHIPVHAFISPDMFKHFEIVGQTMGFTQVISGPYVRSSYRAGEVLGLGKD